MLLYRDRGARHHRVICSDPDELDEEDIKMITSLKTAEVAELEPCSECAR